jgi:hypothetical protein
MASSTCQLHAQSALRLSAVCKPSQEQHSPFVTLRSTGSTIGHSLPATCPFSGRRIDCSRPRRVTSFNSASSRRSQMVCRQVAEGEGLIELLTMKDLPESLSSDGKTGAKPGAQEAAVQIDATLLQQLEGQAGQACSESTKVSSSTSWTSILPLAFCLLSFSLIRLLSLDSSTRLELL